MMRNIGKGGPRVIERHIVKQPNPVLQGEGILVEHTDNGPRIHSDGCLKAEVYSAMAAQDERLSVLVTASTEHSCDLDAIVSHLSAIDRILEGLVDKANRCDKRFEAAAERICTLERRPAQITETRTVELPRIVVHEVETKFKTAIAVKVALGLLAASQIAMGVLWVAY